MSMMRRELPNNTPEQVREYVRETLAILDELDVPGDLREVAFTGALGLVSGKQLVLEPTSLGVPTMAIPRGT